MSKIDIIGDDKDGGKGRSRGGLYKDVIWVWEIDDPRLLSVIRNALRKWIDGIENFAQYIARRIQSYGFIIEMNSNIYPTNEGYNLVISFKAKGIREDVLKKNWRFLKRQLEGKYGVSRTYRKLAEQYDEGEEYE